MNRCPPCTHACNEGRDCALAHEATRALLSRLTLQQKDGGETVNGALVFPALDRCEQMPERLRLQPAQRVVRWMCLRYVVAVLIVAAAAAVQIMGGKV